MAAGLAFRLVARGVKHEDAKGRRFFGGGAGQVGHGRTRKITEREMRGLARGGFTTKARRPRRLGGG